MLGAIIVAVVVVVLIPVGLMMTGGAAAGLIGWTLKDTAEQNHEGSELIDVNE